MNHLTFKALLACFFVAILFLCNLFYKSSHNGVSLIQIFTQSSNNKTSTKSTNIDTLSQDISKKQIEDKLPLIPTEKEKINTTSMCVVYGPISEENKTVIDLILKKSNVLSFFDIVDKPVYDVFWNLGKNKIDAIELFESEKNDGPFKSEIYKLSLNSNNDWIVHISKITEDENMAKELVQKLSEQAQQIKIGGLWEYKKTSLVYFYQTQSPSKIPNEVDSIISKTFDIFKSPCSKEKNN